MAALDVRLLVLLSARVIERMKLWLCCKGGLSNCYVALLASCLSVDSATVEQIDWSHVDELIRWHKRHGLGHESRGCLFLVIILWGGSYRGAHR